MVLGISLGGHAAWHCILHEPRFKAAIIVIGCPDYVRLMRHRAAKSKLPTWTGSSPPGETFIGSRDFPTSLLEVVGQSDPAAMLMSQVNAETDSNSGQQHHMTQQKLSGKRVLNLSGGVDKLVPYSCTEPFVNFLLRKSVDGLDLKLTDIVFDGIGHEMTAAMLEEALKFIMGEVRNDSEGNSAVL